MHLPKLLRVGTGRRLNGASIIRQKERRKGSCFKTNGTRFSFHTDADIKYYYTGGSNKMSLLRSATEVQGLLFPLLAFVVFDKLIPAYNVFVLYISQYLTFALHFVGQGPVSMYNNFIHAIGSSQHLNGFNSLSDTHTHTHTMTCSLQSHCGPERFLSALDVVILRRLC